MNLFRSRAAQPVTENDLIALHLDELSPARKRAVQKALAQDAALTAESASVAAMLHVFKDIPMKIDDEVVDRNWEALRPSLVAFRKAPAARPGRRAVALAGAAAGCLGVLAFAVLHHGPTDAQGPAGASLPPFPAGSEASAKLNTGRGENTDGAPLEASAKPLLGTGLFHPVARRNAVSLLALAQAADVPGTRGTWPLTTEPVAPDATPRLTAAPTAGLPAGTPAANLQDERPLRESALPLTTQPVGGGSGYGKVRRGHTTDFMLALGGNFILPHTSLTAGTEPRTQSATHAIEAQAAFHQQYRRALGYRIAGSYSRPDFAYTYSAGVPGQFYDSGHINARVFELAGTYVVEGPRRGRLRTSADVGVALLAFVPTYPNPTVSYVYRAAPVLGVNLDVAIGGHWGARVGGRAQLFKGPDFRCNSCQIPITTSVVADVEPSVGVTYRFGKK